MNRMNIFHRGCYFASLVNIFSVFLSWIAPWMILVCYRFWKPRCYEELLPSLLTNFWPMLLFYTTLITLCWCINWNNVQKWVNASQTRFTRGGAKLVWGEWPHRSFDRSICFYWCYFLPRRLKFIWDFW